jgi:hypothetical protein
MPPGAWSDQALAFFRSHAISAEVASACGVTERSGALCYPNLQEDGTPFWRERILREGRTHQPPGVGLVPWWPGGKPPHAVAVVATEGESDALAALTAIRASRSHLIRGIAVVAVPGAGYSADKLSAHLAAIGIERVWLVYDADDAGRTANDRAGRALARRGITARTLRLANGKDLSDCLAASDDPARWLERELMAGAHGAEELNEDREVQLLRMAGAMKRVGFDDFSIAAALEAQNFARQPVLDAPTLARLTRSIRRWKATPSWLLDPVAFILDERLNADERFLLLFLIQRLRADGSRRIGTRSLARQLAWRGERVLRAKRGLIEHGRIKWSDAGSQPGFFRVLLWTPPEDFSSPVPPVGTELPNSLRGIGRSFSLTEEGSSVSPVGTLEVAR